MITTRTSICLSCAPAVIALMLLAAAMSPLVAYASSPEDHPYRSSLMPEAFAAAASPPHVDLSKGTFLVATREIRDPRFMETVIVLIKYDREGAVGLMINRPTEMKLSKVFPDNEGLAERADLLYVGGPVGMNQIFMLIRSGSQPEEAVSVFADVYVSSSSALLEKLSAKGGKTSFRAYAGYAGWAPGQLDMEIARGGWHVAQADASAIFEKAPTEIWKEFFEKSDVIEVHQRKGGTFPILSGFPASPPHRAAGGRCLSFDAIGY